MKKLNLVLASVAALMGSAAFADTVTGTGGSFQTFSTTSNGVPYWNNTSSATVNGSTAINIGNFLTDTGGYALNSNVTPNCPVGDCGVNYEATPGNMFVGAGAASPTSFNFIRQAGALNITLLYANSAASATVEFGLYDATNGTTAAQNHTIIQGNGTNLANLDGTAYSAGASYNQYTNGSNVPSGTTTLTSGSPYANWGIYVRMCATPATFQGTVCNGGNFVTYYFNPSYDQVGAQFNDPASHQHFALFQSATNLNQYYVALEDFPGINGAEGNGDYKDLILSINTGNLSVGGVPEPTTLAAMGIGLAGLGILRKRMVKK